MRHLDLFSGIGGFALAAQWVWGRKHEIVSFCEIDPFCQKVLKKHWSGVPIHDDIKTLRGDDFGAIDLITGGFPCQDLSCAGQRKGIQAERSGLWKELFRCIDEIRPAYTIIENVTALLSGESGSWFYKLLNALASIRYNAEWHSLPASCFGAPHHRDRIFIIASNPNKTRCNGTIFKKEFTDLTDLAKYYELANPAHRHDLWHEGKREVYWWELNNKPILFGVDDGLSSWIHRGEGLGNAIVPLIAAVIMQAIKEADGKTL